MDEGRHANNRELKFEIVLGTPVCDNDEGWAKLLFKFCYFFPPAPETKQQKEVVHPSLDAIHKCTVHLKSIPRPKPVKHAIKTTTSWREQFEEAVHYDNKDGLSGMEPGISCI